MKHITLSRSLGAVLALAAALVTATGHTQDKVVPKLEPIADTKLIMEGLAHSNFRGLERNLTAKPTEDNVWVFARGQALLIAETANLLMLRPPKKEGQATWFARAMDLRAKAAQLAKTVASKDFDGGRKGLIALAASCTACHKAFRVSVVIEPFGDAPTVEVRGP